MRGKEEGGGGRLREGDGLGVMWAKMSDCIEIYGGVR